jgi:hypothetical protein
LASTAACLATDTDRGEQANGEAATLNDAVEFYNQRFNLSLTPQQKADLVAFLQSL